MKFFMPLLEDPQKAEGAYEHFKKVVLHGWGNVKITPRRIFRIHYEHDGGLWTAEVGERDPENPGLVVAIYETTGRCFVMVTLYPKKDRIGWEYRDVHMIGNQDAINVTDFETAA